MGMRAACYPGGLARITRGEGMKSAQAWNASIAKLLVVALLSCGGAEFALGQVTAAISGRVEDPSGAAVAGATVTVTSEETAATRTFMTDDAGNYRFLAMPVGRYDAIVYRVETAVNMAHE